MKYFKVFLQLASLSLKQHFENRFNALAFMISNILVLGILIIFIDVYFSYSKQILGWTKAEVFFLVGLYRVITATFIVFFQRSINYMSRDVENGNLDMHLTKPINSQFFLSFRQIRSHDLIGIISGLVVMIYAAIQLNINVGFFSWLILFINTLSGVTILYGIMFILATFTLWFGRLNALLDILFIIRSPMERPISFLGQKAAFVLTYLIPLAFIVSVPVEIFLSKVNWTNTFICLFIAIVCLYISHRFWNYSLRHYTSASS